MHGRNISDSRSYTPGPIHRTRLHIDLAGDGEEITLILTDLVEPFEKHNSQLSLTMVATLQRGESPSAGEEGWSHSSYGLCVVLLKRLY